MQRDNKFEANESSTNKIYTSLRRGGPPSKKPILFPTTQICDDSEEKIDEDGKPYIGMSIQKLLAKEKNEGKKILSPSIPNKNGICNLAQENLIDITEKKNDLSHTKCDQLSEELDSSKENLKKLQELANRRYSSYFYSKGRGLYGFTQYEENKNPLDTGCQLYWLRPGSFEEKYGQLPSHPYEENAYIFIESKNQLLFGKKDQFEQIKIYDLIKFKEIFRTIMDDEYQYDHKHITDDEINTLITLNCEHINNKEDSTNDDSNKKILSM